MNYSPAKKQPFEEKRHVSHIRDQSAGQIRVIVNYRYCPAFFVGERKVCVSTRVSFGFVSLLCLEVSVGECGTYLQRLYGKAKQQVNEHRSPKVISRTQASVGNL